ncbi:hypothetical protein SAMN05444392_10892 [Seinonella peptonophila]|uniref:Uncharacterized protein n=1 Tax=Seinonella peptonophila TaxID=112248 RepID=A0A1M4Z7Y2_9BACL|nr:hypothetical protein [Seinonella peptonophila]SHF14130.1 hypothetical protein SAMN05444392_10892 [Seinonella peptonophila]
MDLESEKIIVKSLFNKRFQDRILFELASTKKRFNVSSRFNYPYEVIKNQYLIQIPPPNSYYLDILELLKEYGPIQTGYVISTFFSEIDGRHLPIREALDKVVGFGMPSLVSCIPDRLAYLECEQEYGPPDRFIIYRQDKNI